MSDLVGNPEDRFSHNEAHLIPFLLLTFFMDLLSVTLMFVVVVVLVVSLLSSVFSPLVTSAVVVVVVVDIVVSLSGFTAYAYGSEIFITQACL